VAEAGFGDGVYLEFRADHDLSSLVQCVWYRRIGELESGRTVRVMPDGCMDLLWMQDELLVAGPDTTAWKRSLPAGTEIAGLRFRPGVAPALLDLRADDLLNDRAPAIDCSGRWADRVAYELGTANSGHHDLMQRAVRDLLRCAASREPDPLVRQVVRTVTRGAPGGGHSVADLAGQLGISERQLHRRCQFSLGYGVKTLARISRFQYFVTVARSPRSVSLAELALEAGYADQSHLARDVRLLTGLTPTELLAGSAG